MPGDFCSSSDSNWNQNKNSYQQGFKKFLFEHCWLHSDSWHEPFTSMQGEVIKTHQEINPTRITHIFLSLTMTRTQFYCKMNQRLCKEVFSISHFPICLELSPLTQYLLDTYPKTTSLGTHPIHCSQQHLCWFQWRFFFQLMSVYKDQH